MPDLWPAVLSGACLAGLVALLTLWLRGKLLRFRRKRRARRAQRAERVGAEVLERSGYAVLDAQVRRRWPVVVDGESLTIELAADYVVRRGGRVWVAEVKSGSRSLSLRHPPTRRQLLEYGAAFDCDGVLLVDAEGGRICEVRFPELERASPWAPRRLAPLGLACAVGAGLASLAHALLGAR